MALEVQQDLGLRIRSDIPQLYARAREEDNIQPGTKGGST